MAFSSLSSTLGSSFNRRGFLGGAVLTAGAATLAACAPQNQADSPATSQAAASTTAARGTDRSAVKGHIVVLSTGGTIASTHDSSGAVVPTVRGDELVQPVYEHFDKDKLTLEVKDIAQLDSSAMTLKDTDTILRNVTEALARPEVTGVIVTHGTDSMEESAIAIDTFIDGTKPVVLTGAMRPFDDEDPDGPENLALAIDTVADPANAGKGAFIAFSGSVLRARGAYKAHTEQADGFATNNPAEFTRPAALDYSPLEKVRVDIIAAYPGAPGDLIESSLDSGAQGIVIEGMGAGNIGTSLADAAISAARTVPVVLSTRVDAGPVSGVYGGAGGGATLGEKGIISSGNLRAGQSRMLLAAAIATGTEPKELFPAE
ncbi:asparaginase [Corynebacterium sp.]|uniref:asparaginase n=1 Tax=Corynebacterium sp. TaxID=1720 RepID=UPI0026DCEACD|nr:asparaginase [Corynebacterium sp.]MDO5032661.1 asparaginase [Corynebacterium sp.]